MKSIWILGVVLTSLYSNCYSEEEEIAAAPSSEIAGVGVGVDVDAGGGFYGDDGVYYYYDQPIIWIGPGYYYGVYFGDEYGYNRWYGRRYGGYWGGSGYRRHGHGGHGGHGGGHGGHGGGGHGGGGHHGKH
jgi:hypothetical protein